MEINSIKCNILAAAGCLGYIYLVHPHQNVCYGRIKPHQSPVQTIHFLVSSATHLLTADKCGKVYLIDIGVPVIPGYRFQWTKLLTFNGLDSAPLKLVQPQPRTGNYLLCATESGLFCWNTCGLLKRGSNLKHGSVKNLSVCCELVFPYVDKSNTVVDALQLLDNHDIVVSKTAGVGVIFVWRFSFVAYKMNTLPKVEQKAVPKLTVDVGLELKWSPTTQCYLNLTVCNQYNKVFAGDDEGNVWAYDVNMNAKSDGSASRVPKNSTLPSYIVPFPRCQRANGAHLKKLSQNKTVIFNDVACSSDMKFHLCCHQDISASLTMQLLRSVKYFRSL